MIQNQIKNKESLNKPTEKNIDIKDGSNKSYGLQIPTKKQLKEVKRKVQLLKQAIMKQRADRQIIEQELKTLTQQCIETEQLLHKKQEKNQNLLHQSRQLKDILIREKQQINKLQAQVQIAKDKANKATAGGTVRGNQAGATGQNQPQGWKNYLTSFWK